MRRTKATLICRRTKNLRAAQLFLGRTKLENTGGYLGIVVDDALEIAEKTEAQAYCRQQRSPINCRPKADGYNNIFRYFMHNAGPQEAQRNEVQDLTRVVNRTSLIENLMGQVISNYIAPREEALFFMSEIVLNTSIMSLGSKAKVVMAVAQSLDFKLDKNPLLRIISLRNAFAHHATNANPVVVFSDDPKDRDGYLSFWLLNSSGEIEMIKRHEAYEEFNTAYPLARESLKNLLAHVSAHLTSGEAARLPVKKSKVKQTKTK